MIQAVGIDLVHVDRVTKLVQAYPDQLERIFTVNELRASRRKSKGTPLAELFAAKEAVFKVLGTGWQQGLNWTDIEVLKTKVNLKARAKKIAKELAISKIIVDTSSTKTKAVAQAIGIKS